MPSIDHKILRRIHGNGKGWVFAPSTFLDLGSRTSIDVALHRMTHSGTIRRLARGLYDYPKHHPVIGILVPNHDLIAKVLAGRDAVRIQPSGAYAANLLGLSEQVPAKIVYLTDGLPRKVKVGHQEIVLKRVQPRYMATAGRMSGLVIQALRYIGKSQVDDRMRRTLARKLSSADRKKLSKDIPYAPTWIGKIMRQLATQA